MGTFRHSRAVAAYAAVFALSFAWGIATMRFQVFPYSLVTRAGDFLPAPNAKSARAKARREYLESKTTPAKIVFVGDSITQEIEWYEDFPGAINRGISGDTSADVLDRIEGLRRIGAETYVIMIGANDVWTDTPPSETVGNIRRIVELLPGRNLVAAVPPCSSAYQLCDQEKITSINQRLEAMMGESFIHTGLDPARDLADRVHPDASGMQKLIDAIRPHIRAQ